MATLFVDCDDTLVRWLGPLAELEGPHPYGAGAERWEWNMDVVEAMKRWRAQHPDDQLVIWSGGGAAYARTWANRLHDAGLMPPGLFGAESKHGTPILGATYIDDMPFKAWAAQSIHPRDVKDWQPGAGQ